MTLREEEEMLFDQRETIMMTTESYDVEQASFTGSFNLFLSPTFIQSLYNYVPP